MKKLIKKLKKGFTITELVIVIAVIAILAAVLIPTFANVINNANESAAMQEARSEWSNFSVEVATEPAADNDFLIVHKSGEDADPTYTYFIVVDGQFQTKPVKGFTYSSDNVTITGSSYQFDSNHTYTAATEITRDYEIETSSIVGIFDLTQSDKKICS